MIRLDNIGKQNGRQIVFVEASAALQRGEKVGLVGPNGAGKTTLFLMITGQEQPDEGQVVADRGITIGYFSQDVGEMFGRSDAVVRPIHAKAMPVLLTTADEWDTWLTGLVDEATALQRPLSNAALRERRVIARRHDILQKA